MVLSNRSRLETTFLRLLSKCESLMLEVRTHEVNENWRLEKYTSALREMLKELRTGPNQPDRDLLKEYSRRLDLLKGVLQTSKLPNIEEQALASQLIHTSTSSLNYGLDVGKSMEITHRHKTKYAEDLRRELLGGTEKETSNSEKNQDIDELLRHQQKMQERIADRMLDLTRHLKEQASLAGKIVKDDTEVLGKSSDQIDINADRLKSESEKLEVFNKRACRYWVWFMLVLVCTTFVAMVLFMRLFRKRVIVREAVNMNGEL